MLVIVATVAQVLAAALVARSLALAGTFERVLAGLVILFAAVSLTVLGTGLAGILTQAALLATSVAWLAVAALAHRRNAPAHAGGAPESLPSGRGPTATRPAVSCSRPGSPR